MDIKNMDIRKTKAQIAREYPIENQLKLFMEKSVAAATTPGELSQRLKVAKFLCGKAQSILVLEMDVRGAMETLKAMAEVEAIQKDVDDLLAHVAA